MISDAIFSECREYRYTLRRIWNEERFKAEGACTFICLNPSTADETVDDPTVTRCINYAKDWGYPAFIMLNIFSFRATKPEYMKLGINNNGEHITDNPVGVDNDKHIIDICKQSGIVIAAWSNHATHMNRGYELELLLYHHNIELHCLKVNRSSRLPAHPLYLKKSLQPTLLKEMRTRP